MTTTDQSDGGFLGAVSDQIQAASPVLALSELTGMIGPDEYIGDLIKLDYDHADILVHDSHKMQVNGVPHGCLLIASRITPDDAPLTNPTDIRASLLLLRVIGTARLDSEINLDSTRFEIVQRSNDTSHNYDNAQQTDQFTLNLLRYSGIQCRILGTFRLTPSDDGNDWRLHFGADIDNFYAGQGMKIYKPSGPVLEKIVNYRDENARDQLSSRIGRLRYSAAIKETGTQDSVRIEIVADDFIAQRTALFGMTRTGKSNATKTIASALFNLRQGQEKLRVGQLIFDPNGEYANENPQDQGCIRNLKNIDPSVADDVHTYGLYRHPNDPERHITKINFFGEGEPAFGQTKDEINGALYNLYQGKQIIDEALRGEDTGYVQDFRNADLKAKADLDDRGELTRFRRKLFVYRSILAGSGFENPGRAYVKGLFGEKIRKIMSQSDDMRQYENVLKSDDMTWEVAARLRKVIRPMGFG